MGLSSRNFVHGISGGQCCSGFAAAETKRRSSAFIVRLVKFRHGQPVETSWAPLPTLSDVRPTVSHL
jgi:hypothetical protein